MNRAGLRVGMVGCGRVGGKRADALAPQDALVGCFDVEAAAAESLAGRHSAEVCATLGDLLSLELDAVVVASSHEHLAPSAEQAMESGTHVLVEKPAGVSTAEIDRLIESRQRSGCIVKVGFNHRFHRGIARAAEEVHSGRHGELMHLRARYGHGGRPGYEAEWRADPSRSGGGELVDQGMHLLDLSHWLAGELPLHSALLRTQFWGTDVEDNAALLLGAAGSRTGPWAMLHVSWTEWKNLFSLEIYCRTAKIQVDGLAGSYGPQRLRIYTMKPELGPPAVEEITYPDRDISWRVEWEHFAGKVALGENRPLLGDLDSARYAWEQVEAAYQDSPYAQMRTTAVAG
jgi:predicted dehydrogenase